MSLKFKAILLLLFISFKVSAQILSQPPAQVIPDFKFFRLNNIPFTNKDVPKGKMTFFMFFDSDCDHCQHAIKSIGEQIQTFKKPIIFLISIDDQKK